jgi:streptogramin lyase
MVRGIAVLALASGGLLAVTPTVQAAPTASAGRVLGPDGAPIVGAMVTLRRGEPKHDVTVWSDEAGSFALPGVEQGEAHVVRVRRIGWRDLRLVREAGGERIGGDLVLERETDPAALAEQLPANRWYGLLLDSIPDAMHREELVRQCTYCHQQGNAATRKERSPEEWEKVLSLMGRMGGGLSPELRKQVPELFSNAYRAEHAVPALTARMNEPDFAPAPEPRVRQAVVEEWELGHRASMQHDLAVHPDGRIYSVDMTQDNLYRLDPRDGTRHDFPLPDAGLPLGGVFGGASGPLPPNAKAHVGPHSLQVAPDGAVWATLALGNQLGRFDPTTESWELIPLEEGIYPHTLRFDAKGRIWYTMAVSNHVGMLDPATREQRTIRLPARTWTQAFALRMIPFALWLGSTFDLSGMAAGEGGSVAIPVPYGIDVAPDGIIWFSQLNEHRIGRIDPETFEVEMIDTPFTAPRRLRFDSKGQLWIPGFSSGLVSRFDPSSGEFESYALPIEPLGSETPYALNVDRSTDTVWICGTNSDTLIRFEPEQKRFTVYPLPTRVTYTRELDFDEQGRVWTSNSNLPVWQIEGGFPRVLRLDPNDADGTAVSAVASKGEVADERPAERLLAGKEQAAK